MRMPTSLCLTLCFILLPPVPVSGQVAQDSVEIRVSPVRGEVYMLTAAGGNLAIFPGPDGTFVVDADYAEHTERILDTIRGLARGVESPGGEGRVPAADPQRGPTVRFLVNTHWHFDHTGGNQGFARAGALIIAHEAVARLLAEDQVMSAVGGRGVPAAPPEARPVVTFNDRMNLAWTGDLIHLVHMPAAHTDGDVIVHFRDADVIHMGDIYFNGMYPLIDVDFGGNLGGMIRAVEDVLDHSRENTLFIPGHGPLSDREGLRSYAEMLRTVHERVESLVVQGRTREEVVAARPTADLDPIWVRVPGSEEADFFVGLVYDGMVKQNSGG